jgi:uncharacterized protein
MRIIITGGTGLIGRALAANLSSGGYELIILSRNPARHQGELPPGARLQAWDGRSAQGWEHLADGATAIVNLAGENIGGDGLLPDRWNDAKKRRIRQSRLDVGQAVVAAINAAAVKPRVLIQASAVGYYGPGGAEIITEDSPPGADFLARVCVDWEASSETVEVQGVRRVLLRTGLVLSRDGGPLPRLLPVFKLFAGGPLGSGRQYWPWIHIADEIAAIRHLIENEQARGPFNLTAPNPVTNADFSRALGRVLQRPSFLPTPAFALRLLLGEAATLVLDGQRAVPQRLLAHDFSFRFPDLADALADLSRDEGI